MWSRRKANLAHVMAKAGSLWASFLAKHIQLTWLCRMHSGLVVSEDWCAIRQLQML